MKKALYIGILLGLGTAACADYTITMRTTFADPSAQQMKMTSVTRTKGKRQRIEETTDMGMMKMVNVRLILCDLKEEARIDLENRIYTLKTMNPIPVLDHDDDQPAKLKKGTGKIVTDVKVQDKGVEKVAQLDAHHWVVSTHMKATGCIGTYDMTVKREFWTADLPTFSCPILSGTWTQQTVGECQISQELTGDVLLYTESTKHEVVKEIIFQEDKPQMTRELVDYSKAELDDTLFSLDGMTKVSEAQFQQAQTQKMMKMYMPDN